MPKGWVNKTISFKTTDKTDKERYQFAVGLPNCTSDFKCLIDQMMGGNHRSFNEWLSSLGAGGLSSGSHEFIESDRTEEWIKETVEVDLGQFL